MTEGVGVDQAGPRDSRARRIETDLTSTSAWKRWPVRLARSPSTSDWWTAPHEARCGPRHCDQGSHSARGGDRAQQKRVPTGWTESKVTVRLKVHRSFRVERRSAMEQSGQDKAEQIE